MSLQERPRADGFTLVELVIVAALLVPLLLVVGTAAKGVSGAVEANDRASEINDVGVRTLGEIERVLQFARLGTLRVQAVRADVQAGRAASIGDWFEMPANEPRPAIDVSSTTGEQGLELRVPSQTYRLEVVRDAREVLNSIDDDGDGLIDEGVLRLTRGNTSTNLLGGVELCTFELANGAIRVTLTFGRPGHGRSVRRTTLHHTVYLHND